ncbi:hypothetical protein TAMA11512_08940 [Selenomonas sp. TAMA-11512]|nr:hypothetical protein TAMA11512_08940 [Selenomonas sp. TAMA-11512]
MENMAEERKERFEVVDASSAEWCVEKIAGLEARKAEIDAQYKKMIERYDKWRDDELKNIDDSVSFFHSLLRPWVFEELKTSKNKSITLPSGRVGTRKGKETWTLAGKEFDRNDPALLVIAKSIDKKYVEIKESVKWADLKKNLQVTESGSVVSEDGEIIDAFHVEQGEPKFYVEVK